MFYLLKWAVTKRRGTDDYSPQHTNYVQAAELTLYNGQDKVAWPRGITAVSSPVETKEAEGPLKLIDGKVSTKWAVNTNARLQEVDVSVTLALPYEVAFTEYTYTTANDVVQRDPVSWKLYESLDEGQTWVQLDERIDADIPETRGAESNRFVITRHVTDINIGVHADKLHLLVDTTYRLNCTVKPDNATSKELLFTSSDSSVCIVSDTGIITAIGEGEAVVTVSSVSTPAVSVECTVEVSSSIPPTEEDYNRHDRIIEWKLDIHFNGKNAEPLSVTRDSYLVDADLLEEVSADSSTPFGAVTSNELGFTLYNHNGIFSPLNGSSPYYGKIKKGVPIHLWARPTDDYRVEWDELGWFYVTEWNAEVTGALANVTANDRLYDLLNRPQVKMPVTPGLTFAETFEMFFKLLGEEADIDEALTEKLVFAYNTMQNKAFLNELSVGAQANTFCGRDGRVKVQYTRGAKEVKHTLTDANQIISISSRQNAILEYSGSEVVMNKPQESAISTLLSIKELRLRPGDTTSEPTAFTKKPVCKVTAARVVGNANAVLTGIEATCLDATYTVHNNATVDVTTALEIFGTYIETIAAAYTDNSDNLLVVDNKYIQTDEYAAKFKRFLAAYVTSYVPMLELTTRGNVKYLPGEKIRIVSSRYNVDFTGVLIRQKFQYNGGLSSSITVFNSDILEVV